MYKVLVLDANNQFFRPVKVTLFASPTKKVQLLGNSVNRSSSSNSSSLVLSVVSFSRLNYADFGTTGGVDTGPLLARNGSVLAGVQSRNDRQPDLHQSGSGKM